MFCPSCGANNSTEQKFCRSCGMNLEQTALSLVDQFPTAQRANLQKQERALENFGQFALGGFLVVVFAGISGMIYPFAAKMILSGENFWAGILLIAFVFFAALSLAYVFFNESLKEKKQKLNPSARPNDLKMPEVLGLPDTAGFEPAAGVTESTTELLNVKSKTRKL